MSNILLDEDDKQTLNKERLLNNETFKGRLKQAWKDGIITDHIVTWLPWLVMIAVLVWHFAPKYAPESWLIPKDNTITEVPDISLTEEVFVTEPADDLGKAIVTQHADNRLSMEERMIDLESKLAAITSTINNTNNTLIPDGSPLEKRISELARDQVAYYKTIEDEIAKKKGWRNYITWRQILTP